MIWILTACLLLTSCRNFASDLPTPASVIEETTQPAVTSPAAPGYVNRVRNAKYQLGLTDSLQVVQLTDGKFERGIPGSVEFTSVSMTDLFASGDLDADDVNEVAALVAENYGGTGVFVFLVVFEDVNGAFVFQSSALVDDRPRLNELSIANGEIFLDAVIHGFEEPMCCPTLRTTRRYRLAQGGQLKMTDYVTFTPDDRPRTITIESPVSGSEVFNSVLVKGSVNIAPFENSLAYRIYDIGGVELSAGAIAVSAPDLGAPGTFNAMIPLGKILSGAVIRIEIQDINAADGSLFAMDSVELVVK
jgi:hypothetical protein